MINQNKLSEKDFDNEDSYFINKRREVLKMCKVSTTTDCFKFTSALNEMKGTFTQKCADNITFSHDSMFEIVAYHFGSLFPKLILQHLSSTYIDNYIKLDDLNREKKEKVNARFKKQTMKLVLTIQLLKIIILIYVLDYRSVIIQYLLKDCFTM